MDELAAAIAAKERVGIGLLTWGMKASTLHSSMDTTSATALTISEGVIGRGVEKTAARPVHM
jgi:hypothetical protein